MISTPSSVLTPEYFLSFYKIDLEFKVRLKISYFGQRILITVSTRFLAPFELIILPASNYNIFKSLVSFIVVALVINIF